MPEPTRPAPIWDLLCRVVDHRGDAGVCWRLARGLALRGIQVRLWIDRIDALDGMADPDDEALMRAGSIMVLQGPGAADRPHAQASAVIETFGGGLPTHWLEPLAAPGTVWVNVEYLSAEPYVERSHGLASPRTTASGARLDSWFFFPGFTQATGGLLQDVASGPFAPAGAGSGSAGSFDISRYDYDPEALPGWLLELAQALPGSPPVRLWQPGKSTEAGVRSGSARFEAQPLPWLSQADYDRLLAHCQLNLVRGEDSFVRAQWAGQPMLWQIYPQADGAHARKLEAWLDHYLAGADAPWAQAVRQAHRACNGLLARDQLKPALLTALSYRRAADKAPLPDQPRLPGEHWRQHAHAWAQTLRTQADLATTLIGFVNTRCTANIGTRR